MVTQQDDDFRVPKNGVLATLRPVVTHTRRCRTLVDRPQVTRVTPLAEDDMNRPSKWHLCRNITFFWCYANQCHGCVVDDSICVYAVLYKNLRTRFAVPYEGAIHAWTWRLKRCLPLLCAELPTENSRKTFEAIGFVKADSSCQSRKLHRISLRVKIVVALHQLERRLNVR